MTMKTLLLGTAAGLVTLGAAQAADLPMTKAEPVEYVKVCNEFGDGFYYIPGSDTCLSINGYVRADYWYFEPDSRVDDGFSFSGRGRVNFDARTATEYGTLRSFISLQYNHSDPGTGNGVNADKAFIQFGGWTAGYATSFYDFYDAEAGNTIKGSYFSSSATTHLLAYTAVFGSGLAATISIEDNYYRREGILSPFDAAAPIFNVNNPATPNVDALYGGQRSPDIVASLRWTQGWGSAQIMAAAHQNRDNLRDSANLSARDDETEWGWAVGAGFIVNLPSGFFFALEGNYARGATAYTGLGDRVGNDVLDGIIDGQSVALNTGDMELNRSWSVTGDLGYNFTPSLVGHIVASYAEYDAASIFYSGNATFGAIEAALPGMADFDTWAVTANLTYTIVKGLTIAGEVSYEERDYKDLFFSDAAGAATGVVSRSDYDTIHGGIRLKRSF